MRNLFLLLTFLLSLNSMAQPITAGKHTRVQTVYGPIEGYQDGSIFTFKGIRYAKAERFMPPQAPDKFTELRQCKVYGPQAPQSESLRWNDRNSQTDYGFGNQFVTEPMDEQACLVLNVWTPSINDTKKRPVFVWIHGGGYAGGSGHDLPCYEGRALAEAGDIVVVNLNHRLNVLGYIDLTGLGGKYSQSVNLGQQDIVKALEWVRDNIERFGGDPDEVTIGGQSGGGGKVSTLLAMPSAKGLFKRAIVQSGSTLRQALPEQTQPFGRAFAQELGQPATGQADFSKFTYDELNHAVSRLAQKGIRAGFSPVVDGTVLPQHPFDPASPESKDVPMLIGTDFNEFTFDISKDMTWEEAESFIRQRRGPQADKFITAFRKAYPKAEPKEMTYIDTGFRAGAIRQAAAKAAQGGAPAYLYLFAWKPESNALGASHGMELPFMFHNVNLQREMTGASPAAYKFERLISNIWLAFIKNGNPNVKGLPSWEPYNAETGVTMILDNQCESRSHHDKDLMGVAQGVRQTPGNDFVKGADVGFLPGQEKRGVVFRDRNGQERECLELLKNDYQMGAIRMRVWVNPRGGTNDKYELLAMAKRVKALGMDLMVDFHYSDSWADPAKQPIPKAWLGHSYEEMKEDLRAHTIEVLSLLKENGITPRWVQVGNETTNGMLWSVKTNERGWEIKDSLGRTTITHSMGHIKTEPEQYAGFIRTGYDAVKEVFPEAIVIVHLDRGHRQSLYDHNLDIILKYGGKFDMVGMSLYPYWAMDGHPELKADDIITDCMANIRHVSQKYKCDVMIVETGFEVDESRPEVMEEGRRQLTRVIREAQTETNGRCRGVFYWEPQCLPGGYKLGAFDRNAAPTVIMDGFIEKK